MRSDGRQQFISTLREAERRISKEGRRGGSAEYRVRPRKLDTTKLLGIADSDNPYQSGCSRLDVVALCIGQSRRAISDTSIYRL